MDTNLDAGYFQTDAHNPSYFTIATNTQYKGDLTDYCVPVNHYFPPEELLNKLSNNLRDILKYYPDYAEKHQHNMSAFINVPSENIIPVNGSTELITILCKEMEGGVVCPVPTFGRWTDLPIDFNVPVHFIQREESNNFDLDVQHIIDTVRREKAQNLIICNPNNPTGASFTDGEISYLVEQLIDIERIIIDESFIDFSDIPSASELAIKSENVVVLKSMGKALGWHGIRLGYGVTNAQLAKKIRQSVPYWSINGIAAFVLDNLNDYKHIYQQSFIKIKDDRKYLLEQCAKLEQCKIFPSQANFIYMKLPDHFCGKRIRDALNDNFGLIIRECSNKIGSSENYCRIAVHKRKDTDKLINALNELLSIGDGA